MSQPDEAAPSAQERPRDPEPSPSAPPPADPPNTEPAPPAPPAPEEVEPEPYDRTRAAGRVIDAPRSAETSAASTSARSTSGGSAPGAPPPPPDARSTAHAPRPNSFWCSLAHLSTLISFLAGFGFFFANLPGLFAPLVYWLVVKKRHPEAVSHAKDAFDFQLHVFACIVVGTLFSCLCCCCVPIIPFLAQVANIVCTLVAAARAAEGGRYRYPLTLRLLARA
jgi:uncharacterized Tic20 family protein